MYQARANTAISHGGKLELFSEDDPLRTGKEFKTIKQ